MRAMMIGLAAALLLSGVGQAVEAKPARATAAKAAAFTSDRIQVTIVGRGPDVILIPGLSSSPGRAWQSTVEAVPGYRYHLVQVKGFAGVPAEGNASGPVAAPVAAEIARYVREMKLKRPAVVGHSMGGKAAMRLALTRGDMVRRLAVLDIAPVAYGHTQDGIIEALEATDVASATSRSGADTLLAQQLDDHSVRAFLLQSLDLKASPPRWKMNLAALRANMENLTGWPGGGTPFDGPALFLRGGDSDYVTDRGEDAIREFFPQAVIEAVPGTGHWLHAEKPGQVTPRVADFLNG